MWSVFRHLDHRPGLGGGRPRTSRQPKVLVIEYLEPRQLTASLVMTDIFPGFQPSNVEKPMEDVALVAFANSSDSSTEPCLDLDSEKIELDKIADLIGHAFDLDDDEIWELPQT